MKLATIYWVRDPKEDTDQFSEITLRRLLFLVNQGRKNKINIAHILVSSFDEVDYEKNPTMVIKCGAYPVTKATSEIYFFRSLGDMEREVVEVLKEEFLDQDDHPELPLAMDQIREQARTVGGAFQSGYCDSGILERVFQQVKEPPQCAVCGRQIVQGRDSTICLDCS